MGGVKIDSDSLFFTENLILRGTQIGFVMITFTSEVQIFFIYVFLSGVEPNFSLHRDFTYK